MCRWLYVLLLISVASCENSKSIDSAMPELEWQVPSGGSVVAADSIPLKSELTKGLYFTLRLKVPQTTTRGGVQRYLLETKYGHGEANSEIAMPNGGEHLRPLIRRRDAHHFVIGFVPGRAFGGDTSFHEYYQVSGDMQGISIEPLNSFQINKSAIFL